MTVIIVQRYRVRCSSLAHDSVLVRVERLHYVASMRSKPVGYAPYASVVCARCQRGMRPMPAGFRCYAGMMPTYYTGRVRVGYVPCASGVGALCKRGARPMPVGAVYVCAVVGSRGGSVRSFASSPYSRRERPARDAPVRDAPVRDAPPARRAAPRDFAGPPSKRQRDMSPPPFRAAAAPYGDSRGGRAGGFKSRGGPPPPHRR